MKLIELPAKNLCNRHLAQEHSNIHLVFNVLYYKENSYWQDHEDINRWRGHLVALANRHVEIATEMLGRKFNHNSEIKIGIDELELQGESWSYPKGLNYSTQIEVLEKLGCDCRIS